MRICNECERVCVYFYAQNQYRSSPLSCVFFFNLIIFEVGFYLNRKFVKFIQVSVNMNL